MSLRASRSQDRAESLRIFESEQGVCHMDCCRSTLNPCTDAPFSRVGRSARIETCEKQNTTTSANSTARTNAGVRPRRTSRRRNYALYARRGHGLQAYLCYKRGLPGRFQGQFVDSTWMPTFVSAPLLYCGRHGNILTVAPIYLLSYVRARIMRLVS